MLPHLVRLALAAGDREVAVAVTEVARADAEADPQVGDAGKGLSNPDIAAELFLSRRAVQTQVSNVLGRLGLSSRLEIVRMAASA
ncbi:hypothetical protein BBK82_05715 [Lentzea guizhouensis]|uniref:HTH luxR-type domain-containing protein n=1 Tax=Lentzea guizhouensis TaxID=1586287 RepID=A0A1B2HD62_9PSEU|nr:helix-turn-helix transcriptional regulator [Lentzea guizhouensis]ANZ35648.1 hypothetical protein BBK82_05715 [Lentzea guizhouensis]